MSIANEIVRLQNAKASIKSSLEAKGVQVPSSAKLDSYATLVDQINVGANIEYSLTEPSDKSKLWIKTNDDSRNVNVVPFLPTRYLDMTEKSTLVLGSSGQCGGYNKDKTAIYVLEGTGQSSRNVISKYDLATSITTYIEARFPVQNNGSVFSCSVNGLIYFFYNTAVYVLDTKTEIITTLNTTAPESIANGSAFEFNGYIYLVNILVGGYAKAYAYKFDYINYTFTKVNNYLPVVLYATSIAKVNDAVYFIGGQVSSTVVNTIYKFDLTTETSSLLNITLPVAKSYISSFYKNGKIYCIGGLTTTSIWTNTNTILMIDIENETIEELDTTFLYRTAAGYYTTEEMSDNLFYIIGGSSGSNYTNKISTISLAKEDLSNNTYILTKQSKKAFDIAAGINIYISDIYFGGIDNSVKKAEAYLYNVEQEQWEQI